jgi:IclR family acetate operon transcriptional repressor
VLDLLKRSGMERRTERTITTPKAFLADLAKVRERGYALDEGEQELGVRCVAVAVPDAPRAMALSMSGPLPRMSDEVIAKAAPILHRAAVQISAELGAGARVAEATA